jgi:hypothetical protein
VVGPTVLISSVQTMRDNRMPCLGGEGCFQDKTPHLSAQRMKKKDTMHSTSMNVELHMQNNESTATRKGGGLTQFKHASRKLDFHGRESVGAGRLAALGHHTQPRLDVAQVIHDQPQEDRE